jgi:hypothetical protein
MKTYTVYVSQRINFSQTLTVEAWDEDHARELAEDGFACDWNNAEAFDVVTHVMEGPSTGMEDSPPIEPASMDGKQEGPSRD